MKEPRIAVSPRIFEFNPELTPSMRCRLINWLIEVCLHFRLHRETLYLTIYFIDRYLSLTSNVLKKSLQLLGISALFVAAKLEVKDSQFDRIILMVPSNLGNLSATIARIFECM